ncbi:MAG: hypothetical protein PVJ67_01485 [Candidatus Pacearchaeota archaeon]|jgi:hypothetical protein
MELKDNQVLLFKKTYVPGGIKRFFKTKHTYCCKSPLLKEGTMEYEGRSLGSFILGLEFGRGLEKLVDPKSLEIVLSAEETYNQKVSGKKGYTLIDSKGISPKNEKDFLEGYGGACKEAITNAEHIKALRKSERRARDIL